MVCESKKVLYIMIVGVDTCIKTCLERISFTNSVMREWVEYYFRVLRCLNPICRYFVSLRMSECSFSALFNYITRTTFNLKLVY